MAVNIGSSKLLDAYVGPVDDRQPTANTIAYYPLTKESALLDKSGNGHTLTNTNTQFGTYDGVDCAYFNGSAYLMTDILSFTSYQYTMACWFKRNGGQTGWIITSNPCGITKGGGLATYSTTQLGVEMYSVSSRKIFANATQTNWNCIVYSYGKLYLNGVLVGSGTGNLAGGYNYCIGGHTTNSSCSRIFSTGYMGNVVFANGERTANDVLTFYNKTKKRYGG